MKLADYSDPVTVDQLDQALRQGGFEGVFHYLSGNNAYRIESPQVVAGIREREWPQLGIDVPTLAGVDGYGAASRAWSIYGMRPPFRLYLDIEPGEFDLDPLLWPGAADSWCNQVRAFGFSPGVYGVDRTVAACSNRADTIWRALPGQCDPAGPGLNPAFFVGGRIVQCAQEPFPGVTFDVNYSQFLVESQRMSLDPNDPIVQEIRGELAMLRNVLKWGNTSPDHSGDYLWGISDGTPGGSQIVAIAQAVAKLNQPQVDVQALAAALAAHLPPETDPQVVAEDVYQRLKTQLDKP